ncbi:MAG TPA: TRAP transporter TatT component family protein [Pyrinomonadaceae bacterium]|nr:TRAP transporter TatT component family protein [Pyrinomonadaceae bacterium]
MINLRKNHEKLVSVMVTFAAFSVVLTGVACDQGVPEGGPKIDHGDAKMAAERIAEADSLYEGREDLQKARVCVVSLRQARTADYGNYEAAWKLARASFFVGDRTDNDSERDDLFREGTEAGKAAVQLQPDKPEGHFWLGANYGGSAAHSTIANLSSFQDIKREMEAVLKIDEAYQGYSAYLGLGRLYLQAPMVLGGDTDKAIEYLLKGIKLNPNHGLMRFHLAEAYESNNRYAEAKKQIEALMALTPDPKYAAEHKSAIEKAQKLLEKIESDRR